MHEHIERVLFTEDQINARIKEIGQQITQEYAPHIEAGESLVLVCILRGAAMFMARLACEIKLPLEMDYMAVSSYGNGAKSSGTVRIQKDLSADIAGKHVIIVEDIVDTGLTLKFIKKNLLSRGPVSVEVAALLQKEREDTNVQISRYTCFTCPDQFVVGVGLDYAERYRNLPYIGVLKPQIYE